MSRYGCLCIYLVLYTLYVSCILQTLQSFSSNISSPSSSLSSRSGALTSLVLNFLLCPPCLLISRNISHLLVFLSWNLSDFFRSNSSVIPWAVSSMLTIYHFSNYIFLLEELNQFLGKSTWSSEVVPCHLFLISSFYIPQSLHTEFIPVSKVFGI